MRTSHLEIRKKILDEKDRVTDEELFASPAFAAYLSDIGETGYKKGFCALYERRIPGSSVNASKILIHIRFSTITVAAQHLTVFRYCLSAFAPRFDVVAFHISKLKMTMANWANALLLTICSHFITLIKCPQIKQPSGKRVCIFAQQKFVNSLIFLHIIIFMQTLYLFIHHRGIIAAAVIDIVKMTPVQPLHISVVCRENLLRPANHILKILP